MSTERRIDHVIEAIDGALGDWSTSPDAMRWTPPEEPEQLVRWRPTLVRPDQLARLEAERQHAAAVRFHPELVAAAAPVLQLIGEYEVQLRRAFELVAESMGIATANAVALFGSVAAALADADRSDEEPVDIRARALELRRTRNTGPSRDVVHQRRPRRVL